MTFTATYRDATGALKTTVLEAATRNDALEALKARGITPATLTEAGGASAKAAKGPSWLRGFAAGVLVALLAGGAWYCLAPKPAPAPVQQKKAVAPKPKPKPVAKPAPKPAPASVAPVLVEEEPVVTNEVDAAVAEEVSPNDDALPITAPEPTVWDDGSNKVVVMSFSIAPGQESASLSASVSNALANALGASFADDPNDTEETRALKQRLRAASPALTEQIQTLATETSRNIANILNNQGDQNQNQVEEDEN